MKHLSEFLKFEWELFAKEKTFVVTGVVPWYEYGTQNRLGVKVETCIRRDDTKYKQRDGENTTNLYEKVSFKVSHDVNVPTGAVVVPVDAVAVVYGNYRNQLSVKAADVRVVSQQGRA